MKSIKFVLCAYVSRRHHMDSYINPRWHTTDQTPPKRELKVSDLKVRDQTLLQLQLAPTAILHLKFEDESLNRKSLLYVVWTLNEPWCHDIDVNSPAPLAQSFLAVAEDPPRPPVIEEPATAATPAGPAKAKATSGSASSQGPTKVPKWLKLGPSKSLNASFRVTTERTAEK